MPQIIVQLLVSTNVPALVDSDDKMWLDTAYKSLEMAKSDWPLETYRVVEVKE
jgi:hypothetical protein